MDRRGAEGTRSKLGPGPFGQELLHVLGVEQRLLDTPFSRAGEDLLQALLHDAGRQTFGRPGAATDQGRAFPEDHLRAGVDRRLRERGPPGHGPQPVRSGQVARLLGSLGRLHHLPQLGAVAGRRHGGRSAQLGGADAAQAGREAVGDQRGCHLPEALRSGRERLVRGGGAERPGGVCVGGGQRLLEPGKLVGRAALPIGVRIQPGVTEHVLEVIERPGGVDRGAQDAGLEPVGEVLVGHLGEQLLIGLDRLPHVEAGNGCHVA